MYAYHRLAPLSTMLLAAIWPDAYSSAAGRARRKRRGIAQRLGLDGPGAGLKGHSDACPCLLRHRVEIADSDQECSRLAAIRLLVLSVYDASRRGRVNGFHGGPRDPCSMWDPLFSTRKNAGARVGEPFDVDRQVPALRQVAGSSGGKTTGADTRGGRWSRSFELAVTSIASERQ